MEKLRNLITVILMGVMVLATSGCQSIGFYGQAIKGQYEIFSQQEPISRKIAEPATPPELKAKFERVLQIRKFAETELHLPVKSHYLYYVDLHRPFVVWNVHAAPELSLEPKNWWFPIVGCASYRGYFSETAARRYAAGLEKKKLDVYVGRVQTYSTLGWFRDPLLNTFIYDPDIDLAEIIFHELAHQRLFISGDTDFNEAFATAVAEEGVRRWLESKKDPKALEQYAKEREQHQTFLHLVRDTMQELQKVYDATELSDAAKLKRKEEIIQQLRARHENLKAQWGGESPVEGWFSGVINNAKLSSVATYYDLVPMFEAVLVAKHGDLEQFFNTVKTVSKLPADERRDVLRTYLPVAKATKKM